MLVGYGEIVSQKAIVDAAYALESGVAMTAPTALAGEVVSIDSAWSDEYQNITVTIVCDGLTEQPIQCYRLSGEGAQALEVGRVRQGLRDRSCGLRGERPSGGERLRTGSGSVHE